MKSLSLILYIIKYVLLGSIAGLLILFFMPDSKLAFNWQSANEMWNYYQKHSNAGSVGLRQKPPSIEDFSFAKAVEKASPSVVSINVYRPQGLRQSDQLRPNEKILDVGIGIGSGVILPGRGYIVTNYHVIADAVRISINLLDGRRRFVEVVGYDIETDIAVLETDLQGLNSAELATSNKVKKGDIVMAIGSPFGRNQSVSLGIVSDVTYNPSVTLNPFQPLIQTDAAINSGNSGGALINSRGEVIGINQMKLSSRGGGQTGINYAIPIDRATKIADDIILHGKVRRNWLGANVGHLTEIGYRQLFPDIESGKGVVVTEIDEHTPAHEAGLQKGDLIIQFDGKKISGLASFYKMFYDTPIGKLVEFELLRDGEIINLNVQLVEQPEKIKN